MKKFLIALGMGALMGCAPKIINDPKLLDQALVSFNVAVQSKNYAAALELIHPHERNIIMDTEGEVKEEYLVGMRRLRISTLKQKDLQINSAGQLIGMLPVLKESSTKSFISKEQRSLKLSVPSSSSKPVMSSSSIAIVLPSSSSLVVPMSSSSEASFEEVEEELSSSSVVPAADPAEFEALEKEMSSSSISTVAPESEFEKVEAELPSSSSKVEDAKEEFEAIEPEPKKVEVSSSSVDTTAPESEFEDLEGEPTPAPVEDSSPESTGMGNGSPAVEEKPKVEAAPEPASNPETKPADDSEFDGF